MLIALVTAIATAGQLVIETRLAAEVRLGGETIVELYRPGSATFLLPAGEYPIQILINGESHPYMVKVPDRDACKVFISRAGISISRDVKVEQERFPVPVNFQNAGKRDVMLIIGDQRHRIVGNTPLTLELGPGSHDLGFRNSDGTIIWAQGSLLVDGTRPITVNLVESHVPEVSAPGGSFRSEEH